VFCGAGNDLGPLDAEGVQILKKSAFEARGIVADWNARGGGVADDLVVHIRDVHDVANRGPSELEETAQDVYLQEGAKVADVAVIVDRRSACVHAQRLAVHGDEIVQSSCECVEKADRHRLWVELLAHKGW